MGHLEMKSDSPMLSSVHRMGRRFRKRLSKHVSHGWIVSYKTQDLSSQLERKRLRRYSVNLARFKACVVVDTNYNQDKPWSALITQHSSSETMASFPTFDQTSDEPSIRRLHRRYRRSR